MIEYFDNLFQSNNAEWEDVVSCMPSRVTEQDNAALLRPIEDVEVKAALHPDKSLGPDGMTPAFYQKYWNIVGNNVIQLVRSFFNECKFLNHLTDTNIVLVPKKKNPVVMRILGQFLYVMWCTRYVLMFWPIS